MCQISDAENGGEHYKRDRRIDREHHDQRRYRIDRKAGEVGPSFELLENLLRIVTEAIDGLAPRSGQRARAGAGDYPLQDVPPYKRTYGEVHCAPCPDARDHDRYPEERVCYQ